MTQAPNPTLLAVVQAVPWIAWLILLIARPAFLPELAPYQSALVPLLASGAGWVFLAVRSQSAPRRAMAGVALGLLSSALWFLGYVLSGLSLTLGAVMGPAFLLAVGMVPIILWLIFGGSIALCRFALQAFSGSRAR